MGTCSHCYCVWLELKSADYHSDYSRYSLWMISSLCLTTIYMYAIHKGLLLKTLLWTKSAQHCWVISITTIEYCSTMQTLFHNVMSVVLQNVTTMVTHEFILLIMQFDNVLFTESCVNCSCTIAYGLLTIIVVLALAVFFFSKVHESAVVAVTSTHLCCISHAWSALTTN